MDKFLFFTDPHYRNNAPLNRTDNILDSQLEKTEFILKTAKERNAEIILGGDMFHVPSPKDIVATRVAQLFNKYKIPVHYIIGNHDCIGRNIEKIDHCKVGIFKSFDWFKMLSRKVLKTENCYIIGKDFTSEMECPSQIDPINEFDLPDDGRIIIVVVHSMITDQKSIRVGERTKTVNYKEIITSADIILCGHYHPGIGSQSTPMGGYFVNPGSLSRLEASKIEMERIPSFAYIEIEDRKIKTLEIEKIPYKKDVFSEEVKVQNSKEEEMSKFVNALEELKDEEFMSNNVLSIFDNIESKEVPKELSEVVNSKIVKRCRDKILALMEE